MLGRNGCYDGTNSYFVRSHKTRPGSSTLHLRALRPPPKKNQDLTIRNFFPPSGRSRKMLKIPMKLSFIHSHKTGYTQYFRVPAPRQPPTPQQKFARVLSAAPTAAAAAAAAIDCHPHTCAVIIAQQGALGQTGCSLHLTLQTMFIIVKLRQGSGKDRQGMAVKAKGLKA